MDSKADVYDIWIGTTLVMSYLLSLFRVLDSLMTTDAVCNARL